MTSLSSTLTTSMDKTNKNLPDLSMDLWNKIMSFTSTCRTCNIVTDLKNKANCFHGCLLCPECKIIYLDNERCRLCKGDISMFRPGMCGCPKCGLFVCADCANKPSFKYAPFSMDDE